jgi:hypothetical protein
MINENISKGDISGISAELFDMMGIKKQTTLITDISTIMNIQDLKKGVYLLKINNNQNYENHRVVIE